MHDKNTEILNEPEGPIRRRTRRRDVATNHEGEADDATEDGEEVEDEHEVEVEAGRGKSGSAVEAGEWQVRACVCVRV